MKNKDIFLKILLLQSPKRFLFVGFFLLIMFFLMPLYLTEVILKEEVTGIMRFLPSIINILFVSISFGFSWMVYIRFRKGLKMFSKVIVEDNSDLTLKLISCIPELAPDIEIIKDKINQIASSNHQLKNILENIADGFFGLDEEWRFTYINKKAEVVLLKRRREELIGKKIWDEFPNTVNTSLFLEFHRVLKEQKAVIFEIEELTNLWYEVHAYPSQEGGLYVYYYNITERKNTEKAHLQLAAIVETSDDAIVGITLDEKITSWNQGARKMFGYTTEEVFNKSVGMLFPKEVRYDASQKLKVIIITENPKQFEAIMLRKDGGKIFVSMKVSLINDFNGKTIGASIIYRDITEKHRMEEELLKTQKLESLGILAGGIAHDFNNILAAITANVQLAIFRSKNGKEITKYLDETVNITQRAKDLTQQFLTFSVGGSPIRKVTSVSELLKSTVNFTLRGSKIKCRFSVARDLWDAKVDEGQISQVINNLILNAVQAMPNGGIIEVYANNVTIANEENEMLLKTGDYVKVSIKDYGVGISEKHLPKIFDPFYTTKKGGNGLGLTTSYSIVKKHEGSIEVESELGVGTTFNFYLPAIREVSGKAGDGRGEKMDDVSGEGYVLLMDDEDMILQSVGEMLRELGFKVALAKDGVEAIELYEQAKVQGQPFDVVVMDLTVPGGVGGREAITQLKEINPNIKAIVSSGYSNDPVMANFKDYGFYGVIVKPYRLDELNDLLNKIISEEEEDKKRNQAIS